MIPAFDGPCPLLSVFDMPTALAFYCDTLGFEIFQRSGSGRNCGWAFLRRGKAELMLNTAFEAADRPPVADILRTAHHGDTILYFGCKELDSLHDSLAALGIVVSPPVVRSYGMRQLTITDPDGYHLCFQHPV